MGLSLQEIVDGFSIYVSGYDEACRVYNEIFLDHSYDVAELAKTPFIVDVGANIGLFSLYMKQKYPQSKILAFEPVPENFEALSKNLKLHGAEDVVTYQYGLGTEPATSIITYFPRAPGNSTFHPQTKELMLKVLNEDLGEEMTNRFFGDRSEIAVPVQRLSHFLEAYHSDAKVIDFLKIDVEGAELEVMGGLDDADWAKIRNVVLEIGNAKGELLEAERILQEQGFAITTTKTGLEANDERLAGLQLYIVVGRRVQ
jgi:FkbM family methyltransferase